MMLLGVVIHALVPHVTRPNGDWPLPDHARHWSADILVIAIHDFRMPLFYVLAGFFGALLYGRKGLRGMLTNRAQRILAPLVLFWPPSVVLAAWILKQTPGSIGLGGEIRVMHFWFLYYLVLFYAVMAMAAPIVPRLPFGFWRSRWAAPALAMGPAALMAAMPYGLLATPRVFWPVHWPVWLAYFFYFVAGWTLYAHAHRLEELWAPRAWRNTMWGAAAIAASFVTLAREWQFASAILSALAGWWMIFGFGGLALRYYRQPHPVARYLADASYWVYIVHIPLVLGIQALLWNRAVHPLAKVTLTLAGTMVASLITYQFLVRHTPLGVLLNGRRPVRREGMIGWGIKASNP
jgi:peptidoglycan/LPS O-acetylase OafA/YrhL